MMSRFRGKTLRIISKLQGKPSVHFLHIGKTGGSALGYVLNQYALTNKYLIYRHGHDTKLPNIPFGEKFIFAVRDPITRFVSAFYSRQRQGLPRKFSPWSATEKKAFDDFSSPNQLAEALSSHNTQEKERAFKAMKNIGHVNSSYWDWFVNEEYFTSRLPDILFICFQEQLNQDFEILKTKLGIPQNAQLPTDEVMAHKNPNNTNKELSEKAIKNLKTWYEKDFNFLNLCSKLIEKHPEIRHV